MTGFVVGLTGGIGSGKSAAAADFAALGAAVVDTDLIAHELTMANGTAMPALRAAFGDAVVAADGSLERKAMRDLVFNDPEARSRLEAILHPLIRAEASRRADAALAAGAPYVVLVVPLLVETSAYRDRVARVAVVDCSEETQVARVAARSGLDRAEIERIMAVQAPRERRLAIADDVMDNDGDREKLRKQVEMLHARYLQAACISHRS